MQVSIGRVIHGYQPYAGTSYLNFEFPLDARRIKSIERHRQGGSLQFHLDVQIYFKEYGLLPAHPELKRPQV